MKTNFNKLILAFFALTILTLSCSEDEDGVLAPQISMSIEKEIQQLAVGESLTITAISQNTAVYTETWLLDSNMVSSTATYEFIPINSGTYMLIYEATNESGVFTYEYTITVDAKIRPTTETSQVYVSQLLEYLPAPGQFLNKNVGNMESAEGIVGKKTGLVTLGAWGGSVTYAFDHTVINKEDEKDIMIYGNGSANSAEPGVVYVMQDDNANGIADDIWYEIKGSVHELDGTIRDYKVTYSRPATAADDIPWEDNQGNTGVVKTNSFHTQAYYPEWITEDSYSISGTLLPSSNINMSNPSFITSTSFEYGYADNTAGGDKIDIADAIDAEGNAVQLSGIDFIKIQTGIQANMGWLGELSTEIKGIADLSLIK